MWLGLVETCPHKECCLACGVISRPVCDGSHVTGALGCPVSQSFVPHVSMTSQKTQRKTLLLQHGTQSGYYTITALLNESQAPLLRLLLTQCSVLSPQRRWPSIHYQHIACYALQHRTQRATILVIVTRPTYIVHTTQLYSNNTVTQLLHQPLHIYKILHIKTLKTL